MLPELYHIAKEQKIIDKFFGYNHNLTGEEGQFYETKNLTTEYFPVLSPRGKRARIKVLENPGGICALNGLGYVENNMFYHDGHAVCELSPGEKSFVTMGANICIFPEKYIYNTVNKTVESMESKYATSDTVCIEPCTLDGATLNYSLLQPAKVDGAYWLDGGVLKQWSSSYNMWTSVPTSYLRISEISEKGTLKNVVSQNLSVDDVITISGCNLEEINGDHQIVGLTDEYIIIQGVATTYTQSESMSFNRIVPDMLYVCEHGNRLWGCGKNEIYACRLGDPKNWRAYTGIASDSYAVTDGTPGEYTGCISYGGYVLFFKENYIIRIYGTEPANYTLTTIECESVMKDASRTLCVLDGLLYYKSRSGICIYDGSIPRDISDALGPVRYYKGVAGACKEKYMICVEDSNENAHVFVYDTKLGLWMHENDERILGFASEEGALYYETQDGIVLVQPECMDDRTYPGMDIDYGDVVDKLYPGEWYPGWRHFELYEDKIEWIAETMDIGMEYPEQKYVSKINMRMAVEKDSVLEVYIQYDSDGIWEKIFEITGAGKRSVTIPLRIRRCDHARLRLQGVGPCKVYSLAREIEWGSDV